MSNWKKWALSLLIGLIVASLGLLLAFWVGTLYMEFAFKVGGS
ncbi:MAG TPA: hypothetical protein VJ046_00555 [Candidatus Paceibacterota bacterium]|nr:hypothetical protein [Candidatus Paceibacterota bacterium]